MHFIKKIKNEVFQRVERLTYLGTTLTETWDNSEVIECHIEKAQSTFVLILTSSDLILEMKNALSTISTRYGVERWAILDAME